MSERLEEIKEIFGVHKIQTFADRKTIPFNLDDIEWLIEQAERVWELEKENRRYREVINNINEKAMLYGVDEQVFEAIKEAIRVLESDY